MMKLVNQVLIIDFDSTFIRLEALDELAEIVLSKSESKEELVKKIKEITDRGMRGEISFPESLSSRLKLFSPQKTDLQELIVKLRSSISDSFLKNKKFFIDNSEFVYIISGGFKEIIGPIAKDFKIKPAHILANEFRFDQKGNFVDIDWDNPLAKNEGKIRQVELLGLKGMQVIVIGDGWTDYQIKEAGLADKFIAFCENVCRDKVMKVADYEARSFDDVIDFLNKQVNGKN